MNDEARCLRCSSKAYDEDEGCISCGFMPESAERAASGSGDAAKSYACKHCGDPFLTSQALAGHVRNRHGKDRASRKPAARKKSPRTQPAGGPRERAAHAARTARARPAADAAQGGPPGNGGAPSCPTCRQALPPPVVKLVARFVAEGVEEALAGRLGLIAIGQLQGGTAGPGGGNG